MSLEVVVDRGIVFAEKDGFRFLELDIHRPAVSTGPLPVLHQIRITAVREGGQP